MPRYLKSTDHIAFEVDDLVARITLNRPEKRNALSNAMIAELHDALLEADARVDVHAVLLSGAGKDFCAGYDLSDVYAGHEAPSEDDPQYRSLNATLDDDAWGIEQTQRKLSVIMDLHKPVIAKVQGNCLAGGTDIALMCDMVLAADDAKIGFPAVRANGTPPINLWFYHIGPQWTKRMLMTGDLLRGRDAARVGLVLESHPAKELDAAADELVRRVSRIDAELLSAQKRVVNMAMELSGARTLQRFAGEMDAWAHLSVGPRRTKFRADMKELGLKEAVRNRDEPFGSSVIKLRDDD
ncbi:MAG: crotonase/enoyl-CoA hydratase family protein [Novosphingobium sp.]